MKAVILAGGLGTRISEETVVRPKPMVEIGGKPILWHIMKIYSAAGIDEFVICCGYKGYVIKEYFANYFLHMSDVTFDMRTNAMEVHQKHAEPWRVTLVDTGEQTMTGGRLKRVRGYRRRRRLLHDLRRRRQRRRHRGARALSRRGRAGSPRSPRSSRRGASARSTCRATRSQASSRSRRGTAPGSTAASSCCRPRCSTTSTATTRSGSASRWSGSRPRGSSAPSVHRGFWQPMDTLRDKTLLEELWQSGKAPWKIWD